MMGDRRKMTEVEPFCRIDNPSTRMTCGKRWIPVLFTLQLQQLQTSGFSGPPESYGAVLELFAAALFKLVFSSFNKHRRRIVIPLNICLIRGR